MTLVLTGAATRMHIRSHMRVPIFLEKGFTFGVFPRGSPNKFIARPVRDNGGY